MTSETEPSIDFNKILVFGQWAIWSRMFGWAFLGLLCGCASFSALRLSGTLEYVDPYMGPWIYFLLATNIMLGLGLLGRLGYQKGLFLVSLYAMRSPRLALFLIEKLLKSKEGESDYKVRLQENYQSFLAAQDFEDIAGKDGPVTGYRAEVVDHVKRQLSEAFTIALAKHEDLKSAALPLSELQTKQITDEVEQSFQKTLAKSTRRWIFILMLIYALTPALLVMTKI